jgi:hypothetical protein
MNSVAEKQKSPSIFSYERSKQFDQEMNELLVEEVAETFRTSFLSFLGKYSDMENARSLSMLRLFDKALEVCKKEHYQIIGFEKEKVFNRRIPIVAIGPKINRKKEDLFFADPSSVGIEIQEVSSQKEADYLVELLGRCPFNWKAEEGCYLRAEMSVRILKVIGVPEEKIAKIWLKAVMKAIGKNGEEIEWDWHIAPLITLRSGERKVIDPAVDWNKALSPMEWQKALTNDPKAILGEIDSGYTPIFQDDLGKQFKVSDALFKRFRQGLYCFQFLDLLEDSDNDILASVLERLSLLTPEKENEQTLKDLVPKLSEQTNSSFCVIA